MGRKKVRRRRREGNKGEAGLHERKRKKVAPGKMGRLEEARGLSGGLRRGIYDVISSLTVNNFPGGCGRHGGGSRVRLAFFLARLLSRPTLPSLQPKRTLPSAASFLLLFFLSFSLQQSKLKSQRCRDVLEILFRGDRKVISRRWNEIASDPPAPGIHFW